MGLNTMRTHLAFVFTDGTFLFREITDMAETTDSSGDVTTVTINSSLGRNVTVGDCQICFLDKCRLLSDEVELEYDEPFRHYCHVRFKRVVE
jgi:hypothetical protein